MTKWCTNEIFISGSNADLKALHEHIVKDSYVNFEALLPIPNHLQPLVNYFGKSGLTFNRVQPNRLGSLTPDAFIARLAELHATATYNNIEHSEYNCYEIENFDFENDRANRCVFIKERSIEESIEAFSASVAATGQLSDESDPTVKLVQRIIHAMNKEWRDYKNEVGIVPNAQENWCKKIWGTKWDADNDGMQHEQAGDYFFMTANTPPIAWLQALTDKAQELGLDVEIYMRYAEADKNIGGYLYWKYNNGSLVETGMSDDEICKFLELE